MMSKRFVMGGDTHIIDTKTNEEYYAPCETGLLDLLNSLYEENEIKNEELIQKKLTNVLLAKIYVAQLSLNPNLHYVEQSLKKEMQFLDKKIRELCGEIFNE